MGGCMEALADKVHKQEEHFSPITCSYCQNILHEGLELFLTKYWAAECAVLV